MGNYNKNIPVPFREKKPGRGSGRQPGNAKRGGPRVGRTTEQRRSCKLAKKSGNRSGGSWAGRRQGGWFKKEKKTVL